MAQPEKMSNHFLKNFHHFFSKLNCSSPAAAAPPSSSDSYFTAGDDSSSSDGESISDLAAVLASRRFFFSSPGRSNSILESSSDVVVSEGVGVRKYSADPYADFRRSMEEMIEARAIMDNNVRGDWEYLRELLSCYLRLNPKHTHKFILSAFSDLLLCLLANSPAKPLQYG